MTQWILRLSLLLVLMVIAQCCDDFGLEPAIGWSDYREARLLYSNAEGVQVLDLKSGKRTVLAKNGERIEYYHIASANPRSDAANARWSPDGTKIIYVEGISETDYSQITIMNVDGTDKRVVVADGAPLKPNWSPNGSELVYQKSPAGFGANHQIYIIGVDGSNERRVTFRDGQDSQPAYSGDGDAIVYTSDISGATFTRQLFMIRIDGTDSEQLTYPTGRTQLASGPSSSRRSDMIVFSGKDHVEPDLEIFLIGESDRSIIQLTNRVASGGSWINNAAASWSNDGKLVVYTQHAFGLVSGLRPLPSVWVMKADGSAQTLIIENAQDPDLFLKP
ncbi:MAG: PD40 domain-containing protein [Ignavibacteriae bacterium]|nr:PD40 domain-containing protein [Ignavibacteriota bacterium]